MNDDLLKQLLAVPAFRHSPRYHALQQSHSQVGQHYRQVLAEMQHQASVSSQETTAMPVVKLPVRYMETEPMIAVARHVETGSLLPVKRERVRQQ